MCDELYLRNVFNKSVTTAKVEAEQKKSSLGKKKIWRVITFDNGGGADNV